MNASPTILFDIFDVPARRSTNVIGNSTMRPSTPMSRWVISTWNAYPSA